MYLWPGQSAFSRSRQTQHAAVFGGTLLRLRVFLIVAKTARFGEFKEV